VTQPAGLTTAQARDILARAGPNDIESRERRGWTATVRGMAREPMFVLLVAAAAIYLAIGDRAEGILLGAFAGITVGLVFLQERRSERALDALRALAAPSVRVIRDGVQVRIPARELVPGDLFLVAEGERVAADALLRECAQLAIDESLLTGEPVPVLKGADGDSDPGAQNIFAGTLVVSGHGVAQATLTGSRSRAGSIGASIAAIEPSPTPLQLQLRRLVGRLGAGAIALCLLLAAWFGVVRGDWLQGVLSGIAGAMGMLPEEFPMALSVFLALGAWRLARIKVLARRPAVIEALGAATVLCVDKTGTLTENRMHLRRLVTPQVDVDLASTQPLPEEAHRLLEYAMLASRRDGIDPMDRAIVRRGDDFLAQTEHLHADWLLEQEYSLTPQLPAMSHAWTTRDGLRHVAAKGAPEAVISLCHLDAHEAAQVSQHVARLAAEGLRVLGVACAVAPEGRLAADQHDYEFQWLGLAAFEDPLRASAAPAVALARRAGIAVAMITGDHSQTALAIARQAGIDTTGGALTGTQIEAMDDAALARAVRTVRVFARVQPEQKLRLVRAFRANGDVVAMTGDGVNDAPALKAAHIGVAMGARGTDVAREAAGLVLLDDDFGNIVAGVRMGRRIFDNLRKVMTYITAIHVPIAGLALIPVIAGLPPLMLPVHVVITEMIIDPVCSLAFEGAPEQPGTMDRPPRNAGEPLVGRSVLWRGALQGALLLAAALAVYAIGLRSGSADSARAQALIAFTVGNLGLVWLNASSGGAGWRSVFHAGYAAFWVVAAMAAATFVGGLAFEPVRELLRFSMPPLHLVLAAIGAGAGAVVLAGGMLALEQSQSNRPPAA
jgi:Ca2+-transporting ATPase